MTPSEIRALLADRRWTQPRLARELGVSVNTVQSWVTGRRNPSGPAIKLMRQLRGESPMKCTCGRDAATIATMNLRPTNAPQAPTRPKLRPVCTPCAEWARAQFPQLSESHFRGKLNPDLPVETMTDGKVTIQFQMDAGRMVVLSDD